jgi:tricarballylate dehydrogenase
MTQETTGQRALDATTEGDAHVHDGFDVVVVGCGIAGLSAAVAAAEAGARVAVLERASEEEFGGNTRWTEAYFRMRDQDHVSDDFEELLVANAGAHLDPNVVRHVADDYASWPSYVKAHGLTDPELVSTLSNQAGPTVRWLERFGIRFAALPTYFLTAAAPRIMPVGGGLALIEALRRQALSAGVTIHYHTTAVSLGRAGSLRALSATGREGQEVVYRSAAVVLCSGGFEGNPEMLTRYLGPSSRYVRPVARGGYYNRGEGIAMALRQGAAPAGDFSSYHAEPLDPRSSQPEALVMNFSYGILVNRRGQRFVDEAPGPVDLHYDPISRAISAEPEGIAYVIFDSRIDDVQNWRRSIRTDQPPFRSDTIEGLAAEIGVPGAALGRTVADYNAACRSGTFQASIEDGLATKGLVPEKSNWSRPISQAPYYAYPIISGICFTYGGLKTNRLAQVVDADGRVMPGLYAAGEAAGLYHQVYTGATSVLRGAVFGRIAGTDAAARGIAVRTAS